jgi:nucleotide-binding universal stress UspA family protein
MERSLRAIVDRLGADTGRPVTAEVAEGFDVAKVLIDRATGRDAGLVVMATRAPGTVGRALRGSVADRVMRESPRPVVLVPPGADDIGGRQLHLGRVLVPLDGSELASAVVDHLLELKRARELEYVLLEVVTSGVVPEWVVDTPALQPYAASPDLARARADAEARLTGVADRLRAHGVKDVQVRVLDGVDPAAAITRAVRRELVDLIAMSTRGASGLKRFVLGSVAEKVVRESDVPVLLVAPRD